MVLSDEWFEYHLTPRGWEEGSEDIDVAGLREKPVPKDRVLTLRFHERTSSPYSRQKDWTTVEWSHEDKALIAKLKKEYGSFPPGRNQDKN